LLLAITNPSIILFDPYLDNCIDGSDCCCYYYPAAIPVFYDLVDLSGVVDEPKGLFDPAADDDNGVALGEII